MKQNLKYIVISDFDGTVSTNDVYDLFFSNFSDFNKVDKLYSKLLNKEISATTCWEECFQLLNEVDTNKLDSFILEQKIDSSFTSFKKFCNSNNIPLIILSDGMEYYIKKILKRENITVPVYANNWEIVNGKIIPNFPFTDSECTNCANCKRNHILTKSSDNEVIVFIGNGYSDMCPAKYADVIFAKDELLKYCTKNNITYFPFKTFADVEIKFEELILIKPKHRQIALHARKEIFIAE